MRSHVRIWNASLTWALFTTSYFDTQLIAVIVFIYLLPSVATAHSLWRWVRFPNLWYYNQSHHASPMPRIRLVFSFLLVYSNWPLLTRALHSGIQFSNFNVGTSSSLYGPTCLLDLGNLFCIAVVYLHFRQQALYVQFSLAIYLGVRSLLVSY